MVVHQVHQDRGLFCILNVKFHLSLEPQREGGGLGTNPMTRTHWRTKSLLSHLERPPRASASAASYVRQPGRRDDAVARGSTQHQENECPPLVACFVVERALALTQTSTVSITTVHIVLEAFLSHLFKSYYELTRILNRIWPISAQTTRRATVYLHQIIFTTKKILVAVHSNCGHLSLCKTVKIQWTISHFIF